jgi:3-oxoacyl-[acyl-carrier protein] reductase
MDLLLTGKTALIGGSTQGIGLAVAIELAELGADCILLARNEERLLAAKAQLNTARGQVHQTLVADFSNTSSVEAAIALLLKNNRVDILVNNTGGPPAGPITQATPDDFLSALNLHLINNHLLATAVLPGMKEQGYGRIINIVSTSVKVPLPNLGVSNTTRAAVAAWAKTMANEVAVHGITVNNVLPGATATARLSTIISNKAAKTNTAQDAVEAEMLHEIPMRRFGQAHEIAAMAAFLATPAAAYITGQSICVDGGRTGSI